MERIRWIRWGWLSRCLLATVLLATVASSAAPNQPSADFTIRITPVAGSTVVYSLLRSGAPIEYSRTRAVVSRSIGKEETLGLLVQTVQGEEALVEVFQSIDNQQRPSVSGRGRNVVVRVAAGRSEFTGF
jgi:uncharacterized protein involved in exopolysaccharide biosynthesis